MMPWYGWVIIALIAGLSLEGIATALSKRPHCRVAVGGVEWCPQCHGDDPQPLRPSPTEASH